MENGDNDEMLEEVEATEVTDQGAAEEEELEEGEIPAEGEDTEDAADTEGEADAEAGDETSDGELGARAQKRIQKLIAEKKEATAKFDAVQKELEKAKRLSGEDGKAIIAAAEKSGILPELMTKDEAEAFRDLDDLPRIISSYEDWLDDHEREDTITIGDKELSYSDVKKRVRRYRGEYEVLRSEYGERRKELQAKVKEIFDLGTAAMKAGWKPGEKKSEKTKLVTTRPSVKSAKPTNERRVNPDDIDVNSEDDLEEYIARSRKKR